MICYRDMTFCIAQCLETRCNRILSEKVVKEAAAWWGGDDAPIAQSDFSAGCNYYKPKGQTDESVG